MKKRKRCSDNNKLLPLCRVFRKSRYSGTSFLRDEVPVCDCCGRSIGNGSDGLRIDTGPDWSFGPRPKMHQSCPMARYPQMGRVSLAQVQVFKRAS
jgi:hypothetical protein